METYIPYLSTFFLRMIEVFSQIILVLVISNTKTSIKKFFIVSFLLSVLFEIIKMTMPEYLTALIASILAILTMHFIFKIDFKNATLSYLITIICTAIIDCIFALLILNLYNLSNLSKVSESNELMFLGRISISVSIFFIALIIKNIRQQKEINTINNIRNSINLVTILVTFFLLLPNLVMIIYHYDNKPLPLIVILINIAAIIATFIINILNTRRGIRLVQAEEELVSEKIYNDTLKHLVDNLRTFKHDSDNTLITIDGYVFTEDWEGLKIFIKDVIKESKAITALGKLNPDLFKNPSLYGLVTAKFEYAKKNDVSMNFEIYADIDNINMKAYDFTRILGIFLDNAIEASAGSEKKIVNLYVAEKNNKITVDISNSFSDTGLKIEDINKKGVSSKGENRGLGLYKVKDILSKYPKIKHETTATNGMFLQRLIIDKIKLPV